MFGVDQKLERFDTHLCQMIRKLDSIIALLQLLVEQEQSYIVTIDEHDRLGENLTWTGQTIDHD